MSIIEGLLNFWHRRNSNAYLNYLRSKGCKIGEGSRVRFQRTAMIDITRPALITIGKNVDMNRNFQIYTHDYACTVFIHKYNEFVNSSGAVTIGDNVYFGADVIVLKGVTIGSNCIIGAGSVVTKDIPSDSVAVGNPCVVVASLEKYFQKRIEKGLAEAVEYVKAIQKRFGRNPLLSEMGEEFIYFMGGQDIAERQLGDSYSIWQKLHKPKFSSFEEFLKYCNNSGEYNGKK